MRRPGPGRLRCRHRILLAGAVAAAGLALAATPASAHAAVLSSSPAPGAHLGRAPTAVTVVFDQPVQPDNGGLVVLDSSGARISTDSSHPRPDRLRAALPPDAGNGAYVANYTVTSADGHVVSGGIVFLVGRATVGQVTQLARSTPAGPEDLSDLGQFLLYVGVLAAGGLAFFLAFVMDEGDERRALRRLTLSAAALAVAGMAVATLSQAGLLSGGWSGALSWGPIRQTLGSRFGAQCGLQLIGLAACLWSLWGRPLVARQVAAFYGMGLAAGALAVFGHDVASPDRAVAVPADVVHAVFASLWIGGLAALGLVLRARLRGAPIDEDGAAGPGGAGGGRPADRAPLAGPPGRPTTALLDRPRASVVASAELLRRTAGLVARFSTMAGISVLFLVGAGLALAIVEVGSVSNLVETGYGQLLVLKLALVAVLFFLAAYNRFVLVPLLVSTSEAGAAEASGSLRPAWRRLRATARLELLGVLLVLVVTTLLANGTPSNGASAGRPVPFFGSRPFGGGQVSLHITPNQALVNDFVVQFSDARGVPQDMAESVSVYLLLPAQNVGPIETDLKKVGVGRFALRDSPYPPIVGTWQIVLQVQVSQFSQPDVSFTDQVA